MGVLINIRSAFAGRPAALDSEPGPAAEPSDRRDAFADLAAASLDELPVEYLRALEHVPVLIADDGAAVGAYGLYHGAGVAHPDAPARIVLFRDTLTRDFGADPARLAAEIRRTVRHEVAHHLGYREAGVRALGL